MRSLTASFLTLLVLACSSSTSEPGASAPDSAKPVVPDTNEGESEESKERSKDRDTTVTLGLATEDFWSVGMPLDHVQITAKVDGVVAADKKLEQAQGKAMMPFELPLAAPANKLDANIELSITAYMSPTSPMVVVQRLVTAKFVPRKAKLAYVLLELRCNTAPMAGGGIVTGPTCTDGTTCIGHKCVSPEMTELVDYYADWAKKPPSRCGSAPDATLDVGEGLNEFASLTDGATVTLEAGPQCGHHIWIATRMKNLQQSGTTTTISAVQPGSNLTVPPTAYPYAYAESAGTCELPGLRFQVDLGAKVAELLGKPLDITVEATDTLGHKATVTKKVNIAATVKGGFPHCQN